MDMYIIHPMYNLKIIETIFIRPNINLAMLACAIFVFVSGATLTYNYKRDENLIEFYKRRLSKVLIPFYIAYFIYFLIRVFNARSIHIFDGIPAYRFIFTIFGLDEYLSANGMRTFTLGVGEWFLGCIILCYIAYPFLLKLHRRFKFGTFIIMTICYIIIVLNYNKFNFTIPSHMNFLCQVYNFYLGMFFIESDELKKKSIIKEGFSILILFSFYFYNRVILIPDNIKTTVALVAIIMIFYNCEKYICDFMKNNKLILFFNKISLEIFLVHHFVIYQIDYILSYRRVTGIQMLIIFIADFVITIMLSYIIEILSSKINTLMNESNNKRKNN